MSTIIISKIGIFYLLLYGFALVGYVVAPSVNVLWALLFPWSVIISSVSVTPLLIPFVTLNGVLIYAVGASFDKKYKESQHNSLIIS